LRHLDDLRQLFFTQAVEKRIRQQAPRASTRAAS
jgi:hypothetical protein